VNEQPSLLDQLRRPRFDGATFSPEHDEARLGAQMSRVLTVMRDGEWRTLAELSRAAEAPEASVSARLRDLRKARFGAWTIARRRRGEPARGLWEYRLEAA